MSHIDFPPEYWVSHERLRRMNVAIEALMAEASQHAASLPEPLAQQIQLTYQTYDEIRTEINDQRRAQDERRFSPAPEITQLPGGNRHGK